MLQRRSTPRITEKTARKKRLFIKYRKSRRRGFVKNEVPCINVALLPSINVTLLPSVDIAVDPAHQGRGLGKAVMAALVEHLRATVPAEAYISLIADGEAHRLYAQYGFQPTAPASIGMALFLRPDAA